MLRVLLVVGVVLRIVAVVAAWCSARCAGLVRNGFRSRKMFTVSKSVMKSVN